MRELHQWILSQCFREHVDWTVLHVGAGSGELGKIGSDHISVWIDFDLSFDMLQIDSSCGTAVCELARVLKPDEVCVVIDPFFCGGVIDRIRLAVLIARGVVLHGIAEDLLSVSNASQRQADDPKKRIGG